MRARRGPRASAAAIAASGAAGLLVLLLAGGVAAGAATKEPAKKPSKSKRAAPTPAPPARPRPSRPLAPAIEIPRWLNSAPLRTSDLWGGGKPSLIAFWNGRSEPSERSIPSVREIDHLFAKRGLVVVGIHTPGSAGDREAKRVAATAKKWGFTYPLALDDDSTAWKAFKNRRLPVFHLVDRRGVIRATHVGELQVKTRAWKHFVTSIEEVVAESD